MRIRYRWVMAGILALGLAARAGDEGRKVFAHYMVCIPGAGGRGSRWRTTRREITGRPGGGIDGFALNCGGWTLREPHYKARTMLIYEAARQLGTGFQLMISADYATA